MDIRNFFKAGASKKKKKKKEPSDDKDKKNAKKKDAVSADDFYAAMAARDKKPPPGSPDPAPVRKSSPKKVTPKPTPEKDEKSDKKQYGAEITSSSPRKRAVSPKKVTKAKQEEGPKQSKKQKVSSPVVEKPLARKSPPKSTLSEMKAKKVKKSPALEPKLSLDSFNVDSAVPECLNGRTFVFSGILPDLNRDDAQEMVKELGGRATTTVSTKTDYLVVGLILEDGREYTEGKKYKKAIELGTHVVVGEKALYGLFQQYHEQAGGDEVAPAAAVSTKPESATKPLNPYVAAASKPVVANPYAKPSNNPYATKPKAPNPRATAKKAPAASAAATKTPDPVVNSSVPSGPNTLWVDRYKPNSSREILGNAESVRKLSNWLNTWERRFNNPSAIGKSFSNPNGPFKAALLSGPPGIGKTTTATIVATEAGRDLIEFNASDVRSKKALKEKLGDITGSNTIEFGVNTCKGNDRTKRCIVMDEVDGMGAGDRSGMAELIQLIKNSRVPIICICNDRQSQKMKSLVPYCMDLRYRRPAKSVIAKRAMAIAQQEGFTVEQNAAEAIAESCGNDVRQVLNCMQMWASNNSNKTSHMTYKSLKERESSINKDEILRVSLFDAARTILEGRRGLQNASPDMERSNFFKRNDSFFVDYNFVGLLVQQNYLKVAQGQFLDAKRSDDVDKMADVLDNISKAADSMSDLAIAEQSLRSEQNWGLLPFCGLLTVKTGFHAGGPNGGMLPGFPEFTTWLGRNSTKGKRIRLLSELNHHMNYKISGGTQEMRMSYVPVLRKRFLSLLSSKDPEGVNQAIEMMDEYGLDRDDIFEKLDEFGIGSKVESFNKIESKKKAAFTRTYNSGSHKSQALVAAQGSSGGKKKRGGAAAAGETVDPDAIDDDKIEEEADGDDEEDMEKLKAMFKKKGRKKAAPKKKAARKK